MKNLILIFVLLFSNYSFAAIFDCENDVQESETQVTATYREIVLGDKLTLRFLKDVEVNQEGEETFAKSFFFGKLMEGSPVSIAEGMDFQIFVDRAEAYYKGKTYVLNCSERD